MPEGDSSKKSLETPINADEGTQMNADSSRTH